MSPAGPPARPLCRFEQEKLKQDMLALQRMLETKERKMADLTKNSGQVRPPVDHAAWHKLRSQGARSKSLGQAKPCGI